MAEKPPCGLKSKKDWRDRSKKDCACGGHSAGDVKKNLHHNATMKRRTYKVERRIKETVVRQYREYMDALSRGMLCG